MTNNYFKKLPVILTIISKYLSLFSFIFFIVFLIFSHFFVFAQEKTIKATRTHSEIKIDGVLSENDWLKSDIATDFIQRDPEEGKLETERTEIRVLYDDEYIYFGCTMYDKEPNKITRRLAKRDNEINADMISIRIDSYHDHLTCYEFTLLASGTQVDILQYDDGNREDVSWNAVWDSKTLITDFGWVAEIKIPFKELRFDSKEISKIWGINFVRYISRKNEKSMWRFIPKNQGGFISNFGHLTNLDSINVPFRLEILPYISNAFRKKPLINEYEKYKKYDFNTGFDLKYGLSSNYTLDITVNPDFGQVEADPNVLNLTTFETFYPEKRPFFIEGTQILKFSTFGGDDGLFYSRRIGKQPTKSVSLGDSDVVRFYPENTTILTAAKITGKGSSGFSFGALNAVTSDEYAKIINTSNLKEREELVEPLANYSVVRFNQDLLKNSTVGGILTSVVRKNNYPAFTGGINWKIRLNDNLFIIDGFLAGSSTYSNFTKEKLTGSAGKIAFGKLSGEHWLYEISQDFTSKKYNINDIGYFRRPNDYGTTLELAYKDEKVNDYYRYIYFEWNYGIRDNFDRVNLYRNTSFEFQICFLNFWIFGSRVNYNFGLYDDRETRGNGLYKKPKSINYSTSLRTNNSKDVYLSLSASYNKYDRESDNYSFSPQFVIKPSTNVYFNLGFSFQKYNNYEGFVTNIYTEDNKIKTIFANRDTKEYNFSLYSSITFLNNLSLELFSQLFFASGQFKNYKQLIAPDKFVPTDFSTNYDFNWNTFRFNSVLRWEYLPGSTIYLVWTHYRGYFDRIYDTKLSENFDNIFDSIPDNAVILKISYWLNI